MIPAPAPNMITQPLSQADAISSRPPLRIGTVGLGGYAGVVCRLLSECSLGDAPPVQLSAVCEPNLAAHAGRVDELRAQGIKVFSQWEPMVSQALEAVWLPLPIPLHRPFTERALAAGLAVMCEKPAAGSVQDLDAMCRAQQQAGLPVAIGFQDIYEPSTRALKQAVLSGEIGAVRSATLTACWPRSSRYYARSPWAGCIKQDGAWVMDSPASNALAHFVNLALFLLGECEDTSAALATLEAELYRANPIENYDTCALRIATRAGASLLVLLTHACRRDSQPRIEIQGERGTLTYHMGEEATVCASGSLRTISLRPSSRTHMVERFAHLVRGLPDSRAVATLDVARAHLVAVNGASEATAVRTIPSEYIGSLPASDGGTLRAIDGIEELFQACARTGCLPHETGLAPWTSPAGRRDLRGYQTFAGPLGMEEA